MEKDTGIQQGMEHASFKSYAFGFLASLFLAAASYYMVSRQVLTGLPLHLSVAALGVVQAAIQLILYLDLGRESKPRWNLIAFYFTVMVILIVVIGSMWIMYHLDYNLMPRHE